MDGSYSQSPEDITAESWQEFVDWDAANPVDMGTEAFVEVAALDLPADNAELTHHTLYVQSLLAHHLALLTSNSQCCYGAGLTYPNTTCATRSSELDTSELALYTKDQEIFCTKSKAHNHPPLSSLQGCGLSFHTFKDLKEHCRITNHEALHCPFTGCFSTQIDSSKDKHHLEACHRSINLACHQCEDLFKDTATLDRHAHYNGHSAYICRYPDCESTAGRFSDLIRHQACHKKDVPRHPCPHCSVYRGNNGFKRKDHLRRHIRNYHKIETNYTGSIFYSPFCCKHVKCRRNYAAMGSQDLRSLNDLTQHMLTEHNSSAFICGKASCDRVGRNGFDTKKLLQDHIKKVHPSTFQCTHPGCDRVGSKGWLRERDQKKHMFQKHGISV
ncbi:hypothetical protein BHYA_0081g00310 [Botrytis hyacinthi]|uniref:C2H2-type domain-containing protein n=1 Tax=Botrytis hyacinthi TaxID=278943 RepID=A0A4Z1GN42_9HELO|nr:hypothetical protein BHYA_0081g00310 [Botrytis hyacinthi]